MRDLPLFYAPSLLADGLLPEMEAGHCLRVLRCVAGDEILATDGRGGLYEARLTEVSKRACRVEIEREVLWHKAWKGYLTLAVAPTKAIERMEWLLEKAVEIGVDRVILLRCKHSERKHANAERLERIMISAMKQSQKAILPELLMETPLDKALELTKGSCQLLLHCREGIEGLTPRQLPSCSYPGQGDATLLIGPEGDFSVEEVLEAQRRGAHPTTLGDTRLRTETAALVALQWVHTLQLTTTGAPVRQRGI